MDAKHLAKIPGIVAGVVLVFLGVAGTAQQSSINPAATTKQESSQKQPCQPPKPKSTPDPLPPASWEGKGPKTALTILRVTVDKKGKVHNPVVVRSGGKDVDKQATDAVSGWRFTPAKCGSEPLETQINIEVNISLR